MASPLQRIRSAFQRQSSQSKSPTPEPISFEDPPLTPIILNGYKDSTSHKLLNIELAEKIRENLPTLIQINHDWHLVYSIDQCGTSLQTLYSNCKHDSENNKNRRRGYLIIVQDTHHNIFGAYINDYLHIQEGKTFYGNGDCFLWKKNSKDINDNSLKVFNYTGINDFIIYSDQHFISVGSGDGKFGLWFDSNLQIGASDTVETFNNEPLSDSSKFNILALEIWKVC